MPTRRNACKRVSCMIYCCSLVSSGGVLFCVIRTGRAGCPGCIPSESERARSAHNQINVMYHINRGSSLMKKQLAAPPRTPPRPFSRHVCEWYSSSTVVVYIALVSMYTRGDDTQRCKPRVHIVWTQSHDIPVEVSMYIHVLQVFKFNFKWYATRFDLSAAVGDP